jgi:hypothetical protein
VAEKSARGGAGRAQGCRPLSHAEIAVREAVKFTASQRAELAILCGGKFRATIDQSKIRVADQWQ